MAERKKELVKEQQINYERIVLGYNLENNETEYYFSSYGKIIGLIECAYCKNRVDWIDENSKCYNCKKKTKCT